MLGRCKDMQPIGGPITLLEHVSLLNSTLWTYYLRPSTAYDCSLEARHVMLWFQA
jgi:hypothetical protein